MDVSDDELIGYGCHLWMRVKGETGKNEERGMTDSERKKERGMRVRRVGREGNIRCKLW